MYFIGIDPGKTGAAFIIREITKGSRELHLYSFKSKTEFLHISGFSNLLGLIGSEKTFVFLEKVHAMPGQGVGSMFSFGVAIGYVKGILEVFGFPYSEIRPQEWQKEFSLTGPYNSKHERKKAHLALAKKLYPNVQGLNIETADSVLIAEYARRKYYVV